MLIIGHDYIPSQPLYFIESKAAILHTPSNSTILINFKEENLDLVTHANENTLPFALEVESLVELLFAHNLQAKYIIVPSNLAHEAQKIAENYLFDAKILVEITTKEEIEHFAKLGVDGVIFSDAIIKITS